MGRHWLISFVLSYCIPFQGVRIRISSWVLPFYITLGIFLFLSGFSYSQKTITGMVTQAGNGEPLTGVNIIIRNTTMGTTTGTDGRYSLIVPEVTEKLIFSYMGMITQEIDIADRDRIDVVLKPDLLEMEGVVVTAIGIPREQKALGYSVQELSGDELTQVPHDNFINSLHSRVAGVQITGSSGSAGSSSYITIRGATSIDGNNQPLFVLDGVPIANTSSLHVINGVDMSNRAMDLNPEDIESVSVLKGGAATALYGMRAANGAILITSRKGNENQSKALTTTFNTSLTFSKVSKLPKLQQRYGQGIFGTWMSGAPVTWGPRLDTCSYSIQPGDWIFPEYDVDGAIVGINNPNASGEEVRKYDPYDIFRTGVSQQYALEVAGGGEKAAFITSASYTNTEGVLPGNRWGRITVRIAGNAKVNDKFKLTGSANYIHSGGDRLQKGSNTSSIMLGMLRTPVTFDDAAGYELPSGEQRNFQHGSGYDNPYWSLNKNTFTDNVDRLIGYAGFDWFITRWLSVNYRIGIDYYGEDWRNVFAKGSAEYPYGYLLMRKYTQRDINSDLMLNFSRQIRDYWTVNFTFGQNMFSTRSNELTGTANGFEIPGFYQLSNTSDLNATESMSQVRRAAFFGILEIEFRRMLFFTLTGRNEWSTTLPEANNSFFYPSASIAWIFTEMDPLAGNSILPFGKLRLSFARIANDAEPYRTSTGYRSYNITDPFTTTGLTFPLLGNAGYSYVNIKGNENLKPEMTTTWEAGTDLRWLDNRLALDFTWFHQHSEDLLLNVPVSHATGYYFMYINAGSMTSRGIEAVLAVRPVKSPSWQWDATFNITRITNKVDELARGVDAVALASLVNYIAARAGYPYQSFFGYDWKRDDHGNLIINDNPQSASYGFPMGNYDSLVYEGTVNPDWILGWSNTVTWKGLSLSFLLEWKKGGKLFNGTRGSLYYFGGHGDQEGREPEDTYIFNGVKQSDGSPNDIPVVKGMNWYLLGEGSSFTGPDAPYIEDAGYIRLREIRLSYSFDALLKQKSRIRSVMVYLSGNNLLLFTKYSGIDPETSLLGSSNAQGYDYYNMPGTKGVTLGLRMVF